MVNFESVCLSVRSRQNVLDVSVYYLSGDISVSVGRSQFARLETLVECQRISPVEKLGDVLAD